MDTKIALASNGGLKFKNLGVGGRVSRINIELEAIVWQFQGRKTTATVKRESRNGAAEPLAFNPPWRSKMRDHEMTDSIPDPRFPSGSWTGFFLQYWLPGRHRTDLTLTCQAGVLTGRGQDRAGPYTVDGSYNPATGACEWTKQYIGRHAVAYRGVNDGRGIWGVWEIRVLGGLYVDRGGFHLWPAGTDVSEESDRTEQAVLDAMRTEFGGRSYRLIRAVLVAGVAVALAVLIFKRWNWVS